ncbi:MAG: hypothetical protein ACREJ3_06920 [Polyangiaceae bacterium]
MIAASLDAAVSFALPSCSRATTFAPIPEATVADSAGADEPIDADNAAGALVAHRRYPTIGRLSKGQPSPPFPPD